MSRTAVITMIVMCLLFTYSWIPLQSGWQKNFSQQTAKTLKQKLKSKRAKNRLVINQATILCPNQLIKFYQQRNYELVWLNEQGLGLPAYKLLRTITRSTLEGLDPNDYHREQLAKLINKINAGEDKSILAAVKFDLLLTDAFFAYSCDLLLGKSREVRLQQKNDKQNIDLVKLLGQIAKSGEVKPVLAKLRPKQLNYNQLCHFLINYQRIAAQGGWPKIKGQDKLKKGDYNQRVANLKERLIASGDLKPKKTSSEQLFDSRLQQAVRRFQHRHGLKVTGVVNKETLQALNVSAAKRVKQIKLNLDRLRQLPRDLGEKYILVNIPAFQLKVIEKGRLVRTMRIIVGKPARETPVFSDQIIYLVFNPYWNIPRRIAVDDLLPIIQKKPQYLAQKNIEVLKKIESGWRQVAAQEVNWRQVTADNFDYRLRQQPGSDNALGQVKFIFPNQYSVYLHDTPTQDLFKREYRAFSSGCIRIKRPLELAHYLLQNNSQWTPEKINRIVKQKQRVKVQFKQPIPVYLIYLTAWVNEDDNLQFRNDIYNQD